MSDAAKSTDSFLNQHRAMRGLTQAAEAAGVTIECGIDVTGMDVQQTAQSFGIEIDGSSVFDSWAGLYPSTPDPHPIIDRTGAGLVVVGGFAGLGLMHAPAAGLVAAELIVDGRISSLDPNEVSLERFSKPIESVEQTGF